MSDEENFTIEKITENILNEIKNKKNTNEDTELNSEGKVEEDVSIDTEEKNNFENLRKLEKLNKKITKKNIPVEEKKLNWKDYLKESILIFILFIILNHSHITNMFNYIPLDILKDNNILQLILRGVLMIISYYLFKFFLN